MILAKGASYSFSKNKIWDETHSEKKFYFVIQGEKIFAYYGVKLSLEFD